MYGAKLSRPVCLLLVTNKDSFFSSELLKFQSESVLSRKIPLKLTLWKLELIPDKLGNNEIPDLVDKSHQLELFQ